MTARKGLRAKVTRARLTPLAADGVTAVPLWDYEIRTPGSIVVYGNYETLEQAHDDATAMVRSMLEIRRQGYLNGGSAVVDCPYCGDPARGIVLNVMNSPRTTVAVYIARCESCAYEGPWPR